MAAAAHCKFQRKGSVVHGIIPHLVLDLFRMYRNVAV